MTTVVLGVDACGSGWAGLLLDGDRVTVFVAPAIAALTAIWT